MEQLRRIVIQTCAVGIGSVEYVKATLEPTTTEKPPVVSGIDCVCGRCREIKDKNNQFCCGRKLCVTKKRLFHTLCLDKELLDMKIGVYNVTFNLEKQIMTTQINLFGSRVANIT